MAITGQRQGKRCESAARLDLAGRFRQGHGGCEIVCVKHRALGRTSNTGFESNTSLKRSQKAAHAQINPRWVDRNAHLIRYTCCLLVRHLSGPRGPGVIVARVVIGAATGELETVYIIRSTKVCHDLCVRASAVLTSIPHGSRLRSLYNRR